MDDQTEDAAPPGSRVMVKRHRLLVRINHWINVLALSLLLVSGLGIFNAHPMLYWGKASSFANPWLSMTSETFGKDIRGMTYVAGAEFDTTGVFGASKINGVMTTRGMPSWLTLPPAEDLADARHWHFFFAWVFAVNGLIYVITGLIGRHLRREVLPTPTDLKTVLKDPHLRLKFSKGPDSAHYHQMQKIAYSAVVFLLLPLVALTGMTMSPGADAAFPFLLDIFGGRQSARSIHFICANLIVLFVIVHLVMVIASGPINQIGAMITGRLAIITPKEEAAP